MSKKTIITCHDLTWFTNPVSARREWGKTKNLNQRNGRRWDLAEMKRMSNIHSTTTFGAELY